MTKITLRKAKGQSYYCSGVFSIGVYVQDKSAILIDSGSDEQSAGKAFEALQAENYTVSTIINTHCHPDHCGGNYYFQKWFPTIKIYAAREEKEFIEDPNIAPRCFCGGAAPFAGLLNKHIAPQKPSIITNPINVNADQTITLHNETVQIISLSGHTPGSIGVITPDNILYSGDALFGQQTF